MEILRCENVRKVYGSGNNQVVALNHIDLSVQKGEFVAIVGASGSGKSTLLHILGSVDKPTEGKVLIEGTELSAMNRTQAAIFRRRKVGLVYQFYNLIPTLTVRKNILMPNNCESSLTINDLIFAACRGGWPDSLNQKTRERKLFVAYNYLENICNTDVSAVDGVKRDPDRVRVLLRSLARNNSTLAKDQTIIDDINANFMDISRPTYYSYVDALKKLFVIEDNRGWSPNIKSKSAIRSGNKKVFIDPSIAVAALNANPKSMENDLETFEFIFENLCIRDLSVYTNSHGGKVSYYHDKSDLEIDCVVHLRDGRYALIECKLGSERINEGAQNLLKIKALIEKNKKLDNPTFLAVLTGGKYAYTRPDGVKVIPIGCLK